RARVAQHAVDVDRHRARAVRVDRAGDLQVMPVAVVDRLRRIDAGGVAHVQADLAVVVQRAPLDVVAVAGAFRADDGRAAPADGRAGLRGLEPHRQRARAGQRLRV